jgi:hypothetical protein
MKILKYVIKGLAVVGGGVAAVSVAGVEIVGSELAIAISGTVALCSAVSSLVKDKNSKPLITLAMKVVNLFAVNFDKAQNDKKVNDIKKK